VREWVDSETSRARRFRNGRKLGEFPLARLYSAEISRALATLQTYNEVISEAIRPEPLLSRSTSVDTLEIVYENTALLSLNRVTTLDTSSTGDLESVTRDVTRQRRCKE